MKGTYYFGIILVLLLFSLAPPALAQAPVTVVLDDVPLAFDTEPVIQEGRVLVPFRGLGEALGVEVGWDAVTRTVLARGFGKDVSLPIGEGHALVNGTPVALDAPPVIEEGRTLVPLRFFSETFGADVSWDGETRRVIVESPPARMYTMGFYAIRSFDQRHLLPRFDAVAFGWARVTGTGEVILDGPDYKWPQPAGEITPERILAETGAAGTTRYLMVFAGDGQGELSRLLQDQDGMARAGAQIAALAREKNFDGVLIDFEGLGLTDTGPELEAVRERFTGFLAVLAANLRDYGARIAVALPPLNSEFKGYDYGSISRYADEIVIMAYDYKYERGPEPVGKVKEAIEEALARVPAEKLVLGISTWSETGDSIGAKIGLAKRYGLKGISLWRLGLITGGQWEELQRRVIMR